ncbi:DUF1659 domain-containing protein [Clostridium sp. CCUG 7971]|uniref:DUF1659 domain-containing protein n=1 Tax=Clostridium sp. CCUG 7971 TaxID=2811414 RepID=UPI001ABB758F|nr:DUF1659 domain-containing protein [Clostridium sp. CCUG 7971]MBO3443479.1 DUF1659 domain-containing protein [Clostridium sp. CCUG 7971]
MAAIVTNNPSSLKVKFDCGKNDEGKTIVKTKSYASVKHNALNDDLLEVGIAITSLQEHNVMGYFRVDNTELSE